MYVSHLWTINLSLWHVSRTHAWLIHFCFRPDMFPYHVTNCVTNSIHAVIPLSTYSIFMICAICRTYMYEYLKYPDTICFGSSSWTKQHLFCYCKNTLHALLISWSVTSIFCMFLYIIIWYKHWSQHAKTVRKQHLKPCKKTHGMQQIRITQNINERPSKA